MARPGPPRGGRRARRSAAGRGTAVPSPAQPSRAAPRRDGGLRGGEPAGGARPGAAGPVQDLPAAVVPAGRRQPAELLQRHGERGAGAAPAQPRAVGRPASPTTGSRSRWTAGGAPAAEGVGGDGDRGGGDASPEGRGRPNGGWGGLRGGSRQRRAWPGSREARRRRRAGRAKSPLSCLSVPELWRATLAAAAAAAAEGGCVTGLPGAKPTSYLSLEAARQSSGRCPSAQSQIHASSLEHGSRRYSHSAEKPQPGRALGTE